MRIVLKLSNLAFMKTTGYFFYFFNAKKSKFLLFFYLTIFSSLNIISGQNNLLDAIDLDFSYHVIDRTGSKDVFVKWNEFDLHNAVYVNNSLINRNGNTNGLFLTNVTFPFVVRIVQNQIGSVVNDKEFTIVEKDNSIVDVSDQMFSKLTEWEDSSDDLFSFFETDQTIPKEELFSFYQSYLSISPRLMNEILTNGSVISTTKLDFGGGYWSKGPRGGDTIPPVECNCKMIRTNSSALNTPNGNPTGSSSPQCNMASPTWQNPEFIYETGGIFWPTLIHFKWDAGLIGASKFGQMGLSVLGCKNTGVRRKTIGEGGLGASSISFRMSCYSPQTIRYNDKCQCDKKISINYQYGSHVRVSSTTNGGGFCDRSSKMKIEDYAILTSRPGTGTATAVNSGIALVSTVCERPADTSFISDISSIYNTLSTVLQSGTSATQIINGVGSVAQFFATQIANSGTCEVIDTAYTLLAGGEMYNFNSNQRQITFTVLSRANFEGEAKGVSGATGALNSSFYLAAVLETENPTKGCCQEKIGSYVLGTMMGFPVNNNGSPNVISSGQIPDLGTLQASVGSFIGLFSPWGGNFQGSGCCDDVLIDCYSKCVHFLEDECKNIDDDGFDSNSTENRNRLEGSYTVYVSPVPAYLGQQLKLKFSEIPSSVEILNLDGHKLRSHNCYETNLILSTQGLSSGVYLIKTVFKDGFKLNRVVIQ